MRGNYVQYVLEVVNCLGLIFSENTQKQHEDRSRFKNW